MTALRDVEAEFLDPRNYVEKDDFFDDHEPRKRKPYRCSDGMCGATDCDRCYPGGVYEGDEEEEPCELDYEAGGGDE